MKKTRMSSTNVVEVAWPGSSNADPSSHPDEQELVQETTIAKDIWDYFLRRPNTAICYDCQDELKTTNGATSSLYNHMVKKHNVVVARIRKFNPPSTVTMAPTPAPNRKKRKTTYSAAVETEYGESNPENSYSACDPDDDGEDSTCYDWDLGTAANDNSTPESDNDDLYAHPGIRKLRKWIWDSRTSRRFTNSLLKILACDFDVELPRSFDALMGSPTSHIREKECRQSVQDPLAFQKYNIQAQPDEKAPSELQAMKEMLNNLQAKVKSMDGVIKILYGAHVSNETKGEPIYPTDPSPTDHIPEEYLPAAYLPTDPLTAFPIESLEKWDEINERLVWDVSYKTYLMRKFENAATEQSKSLSTLLLGIINEKCLMIGNWSGANQKRMLSSDPLLLLVYESWKSENFTMSDMESLVRLILKRANHARVVRIGRMKKAWENSIDTSSDIKTDT